MWKKIDECDGYEICETGDVRNIETDKIVSRNKQKTAKSFKWKFAN